MPAEFWADCVLISDEIRRGWAASYHLEGETETALTLKAAPKE